MPMMIGVDPHKASHTAAALDEHGQLLDQQRFPATIEGYQALRASGLEVGKTGGGR